jgi:hypothetical protein
MFLSLPVLSLTFRKDFLVGFSLLLPLSCRVISSYLFAGGGKVIKSIGENPS